MSKPSKFMTASNIIDYVQNSMCDNYCKYAEKYQGMDTEVYELELLDEICDSCPLNLLG